MNHSAPYTSESQLATQRYHPRTARVGSLTSPMPEEDVPDSPPTYSQQPSKRRLTICVVGSGGVGKSSLTVRYLNNHFPEVSERESLTCTRKGWAWHVTHFSFLLTVLRPYSR